MNEFSLLSIIEHSIKYHTKHYRRWKDKYTYENGTMEDLKQAEKHALIVDELNKILNNYYIDRD